MTENQPIVAAVDGSAGSNAAVLYAAARALESGRPLTLVHVAPIYLPLAGLSGYATGYVPTLFDDIGKEVLAGALDLAHTAAPGLEVSTRLMSGSPAATLNTVSMHAHEVVLGADHLSRLERYTFGSVVGGVAAGASTPVTVVPDSWKASAQDPEHVLVGIKDYNHVPEHLLREAFTTARDRHATLEFIHVWDLPRKYAEVVESLMEYAAWQWNVEQQIGHAIADLQAEFPDVQCTVTAAYGRPAELLRNHSAGATLLLLGRRPHHVQHFGHIGHSLLRSVTCPTRIIPVPRVESGSSGIERSEPVSWATTQA